jgi:hypothetical protein
MGNRSAATVVTIDVQNSTENNGVHMTVFFDKVVNAMHVQRNWLRAMICSIGDAVIATNTLGIVTFIDSGLVPPIEWTRGNALGKRIRKVLSLVSEDACNPSDFVTSRAVRKEAGAQPSPHALLLAKDRCVSPIQHTFSPFWDAKVRIVRIEVISRVTIARTQSQPDERDDLRAEVLFPAILRDRLIDIVSRTLTRASRRIPLARWSHQTGNTVNRAKTQIQIDPEFPAYRCLCCRGVRRTDQYF